jgi:hypothetical protein
LCVGNALLLVFEIDLPRNRRGILIRNDVRI